MADAMVTARMTRSKKEAGAEVLESLGMSASQAINALYDSLIEQRAWPLERISCTCVDACELDAALSFVDSIAQVDSTHFEDMDMKEARRRRLLVKGRAEEVDFA